MDKEYIHDTLKLSDEKNHRWNANTVETTSDVHLEDDKGEGDVVVIREFEFGVNPQAFKEYQPTRQELFNHHAKQIEMMLWGDGLQPVREYTPKITISKNKKKYRIFVLATPAKGNILPSAYTPKTLSQLAKNE